MRRLHALGATPLALAGIAALAIAGCGGGSDGGASTTGAGYGAASAAPKAAGATVSTRSSKLGTVLVDGRGRTLYLFERDRGAASSCSGACASVWPPLTTDAKPAAGGAVAPGKLGESRRADGTTEVTYAGHPLYTYAGDTKPGDVTGQDVDQFGAAWYVLAPSGRKIDEG